MFTNFRCTIQVFAIGAWIISMTAAPAFADRVTYGWQMRILSAYYGSNCNRANYRPDPQYPQNSRNVTFLLVEAWNAAAIYQPHPQVRSSTRDVMTYHIDHRVLGDPALSCPKTFVVRYFCYRANQTRIARIEAEASGKDIVLDCR